MDQEEQGKRARESVVDNEPAPTPRGFARLTVEQRRALGSKGGRTAHSRGTANKFTSEIASRAGKIPHERGTAHHWTSEQAREAGRKGGIAARTTRRSRMEKATPRDEHTASLDPMTTTKATG